MEIREAAERRSANLRMLKAKALAGDEPCKPVVIDTVRKLEEVNQTVSIAHNAEIDYKLNGRRARSDVDEFKGPRWVPDYETPNCAACAVEFDWIVRRHHCRYCGQLFCADCSKSQSLLPPEFGKTEPQRVCDKCYQILLPKQLTLSNNIANHQKDNTIDLLPESCAIRRYSNMPFSKTLGSEIRKAAYSVVNMFSAKWIRDQAFPLSLISTAKGLAFLTVAKGGFVLAPSFGTGLVIARLPDGEWSPPTAISIAGLNWGFLVGADVTDYVFILNTEKAVRVFAGAGYGSVGAGLGIDIAIGNLGRSSSADLTVSQDGLSAAYSYSQSRGLYAGVSLEGSFIRCRSNVNLRFYGRMVSPIDLLTGRLPPPRAALPLYDALREAMIAYPRPEHLLMYSPTKSVPTSISLDDMNTWDRSITPSATPTRVTTMQRSNYQQDISPTRSNPPDTFTNLSPLRNDAAIHSPGMVTRYDVSEDEECMFL